jgi:hypothetical protein
VVPTPEDEDVFFQILEDAGQMSSAVVVDTMIASAWLGVRALISKTMAAVSG